MRSVVPEAGMKGKDKYLYPTVYVRCKLCVHALDTCFWHNTSHMY